MLIRTVCLSAAVLICYAVTSAQEVQPLRQTLDSIDFPSANVAVAYARRSDPQASSELEIFRGFRLASVEGCTVTLRNEGKNERGRYIFEVVIPLEDLSEKTEVTESFVSGGPEGSDEFYPWRTEFRVKNRRGFITLSDRVRNRRLARGAYITFSLPERRAAEKFADGLRNVILMCNNQRAPNR